MFKTWLLDASAVGVEKGIWTFVPYEPDTGDIIFGMNYMGKKPPGGDVVGVIHVDGQDAVDKWCSENTSVLHEFGLVEEVEGRE